MKKVPLKQLCRDIDMEPRAARSRLRQLAEEGRFKHSPKQRWEWDPKEINKIKELLEND